MPDLIPVRFSYLKAMALSAAHCRAAMDGDIEQSTASMKRGTGLHALLFGTAPIREWTETKTRKGVKYEAACAENPDVIWLSPSEYSAQSRMADAISKNADAMRLLRGETEQTIHFEMFGRACRSTPDVRGEGYVTELKSCRSSQPERFQGQSQRLCYHGQLAMQGLAANAREHYVVAVESTRPYPVTLFRVSDHAIDLGQRFLRLQMERLLACEESGTWPPYAQSILELDVDEDVDLTFADSDEPEPVAAMEDSP